MLGAIKCTIKRFPKTTQVSHDPNKEVSYFFTNAIIRNYDSETNAIFTEIKFGIQILLWGSICTLIIIEIGSVFFERIIAKKNVDFKTREHKHNNVNRNLQVSKKLSFYEPNEYEYEFLFEDA